MKVTYIHPQHVTVLESTGRSILAFDSLEATPPSLQFPCGHTRMSRNSLLSDGEHVPLVPAERDGAWDGRQTERRNGTDGYMTHIQVDDSCCLVRQHNNNRYLLNGRRAPRPESRRSYRPAHRLLDTQLFVNE
ncbi:hypothetical protein J6590_069580 [Homalodisca vitripennis]|nr:hypothetical protein J6590_069580 [Homalodisca vitripennis]